MSVRERLTLSIELMITQKIAAPVMLRHVEVRSPAGLDSLVEFVKKADSSTKSTSASRRSIQSLNYIAYSQAPTSSASSFSNALFPHVEAGYQRIIRPYHTSLTLPRGEFDGLEDVFRLFLSESERTELEKDPNELLPASDPRLRCHCCRKQIGFFKEWPQLKGISGLIMDDQVIAGLIGAPCLFSIRQVDVHLSSDCSLTITLQQLSRIPLLSHLSITSDSPLLAKDVPLQLLCFHKLTKLRWIASPMTQSHAANFYRLVERFRMPQIGHLDLGLGFAHEDLFEEALKPWCINLHTLIVRSTVFLHVLHRVCPNLKRIGCTASALRCLICDGHPSVERIDIVNTVRWQSTSIKRLINGLERFNSSECLVPALRDVNVTMGTYVTGAPLDDGVFKSLKTLLAGKGISLNY